MSIIENWESRTIQLLGKEKVNKIKKTHVMVAGLGGVGAYAAEMLCRSGLGNISIIDFDVVSPSNINRQIHAANSTVGIKKTELMKKRMLDINPKINITVINEFLRDEKTDYALNDKYDFVVDAIDTLSPKINLIRKCVDSKIPIISSMGSGAKSDPSKIEIADISNTHNCKLARTLRKRLYKLGIKKGVTAVYSKELPKKESVIKLEGEDYKKSTVGTISYMPAIFGCLCASHVINYITNDL